MWKYVLKRIVWCVVIILVAAALIFSLTQCNEDDPVNQLTAKPVIYLYPEETTEVNVTLDVDGELLSTWPAYEGGWTVTARPDGALTDAAGNEYSYLFWDALSDTEWDFSEGFCVAGEDTGEFLRKVLSDMGLTPKEYNEFIVYWLPLMQESEYNLISFQNETYTDSARLDITPAPNSLLRVFMAWKPVDARIDLPAQTFVPFVRDGFTVVEWGGCQAES